MILADKSGAPVVKKTLRRLSMSMTEEELGFIEELLRKEGKEVNEADMSWSVKNYLFELAGLDRPLNKEEYNRKLSRERYWINKEKP